MVKVIGAEPSLNGGGHLNGAAPEGNGREDSLRSRVLAAHELLARSREETGAAVAELAIACAIAVNSEAAVWETQAQHDLLLQKEMEQRLLIEALRAEAEQLTAIVEASNTLTKAQEEDRQALLSHIEQLTVQLLQASGELDNQRAVFGQAIAQLEQEMEAAVEYWKAEAAQLKAERDGLEADLIEARAANEILRRRDEQSQREKNALPDEAEVSSVSWAASDDASVPVETEIEAGDNVGLPAETEVEVAPEDYKTADPTLSGQAAAAERIILFLLAFEDYRYESEADNAGGEMKKLIGELEAVEADWSNAMSLLRNRGIVRMHKVGARKVKSYALDLLALGLQPEASFITERIRGKVPENHPLVLGVEVAAAPEEEMAPPPTDDVEEVEPIIEAPPAEGLGNGQTAVDIDDEEVDDGDDPLEEMLEELLASDPDEPAPVVRRKARKTHEKKKPQTTLSDKVLIEAAKQTRFAGPKFDDVRSAAVYIAESVGASLHEVLVVLKELTDPKSDEPLASFYRYPAHGNSVKLLCTSSGDDCLREKKIKIPTPNGT